MPATRTTPARRTYVEAAPYVNGYGRFEAELTFSASDKRRALEHRSAAVELTALYGVEWRTPWTLTPGWTVYREQSEGTQFGRLDDRRMIVSGPERAVARYLAALPRVLAGLEAAATRAARAFGRWRRSLIAVLSGHLEYEDPSTLRVRAREFRTAVLGHLVTYLRTPPAPATSDPARPLWEQAAAVAAEVWAERPVDPWEAPGDEVAAVLASAARPAALAVVEPVTTAPAVEDDEDQAPAVHQLADDEHQGHDEEPAAAAVEVPARSVEIAGTAGSGTPRRPRRALLPGSARRQLARRPHRYGSIRGHDQGRRPCGRLQPPQRTGPAAPPARVRTTARTRKAQQT
ncbi:hypothetical protein [Streptomyces atacamensis]|uniref:hypothetical protein n=1 Tax=Streptomyces atacamensis TaxID=531966 RepID=UPI00399C7AA9